MPSKKGKFKVIFVRAEPNFHKAVMRLAEKHGVSASDMIRSMLFKLVHDDIQDGYSDDVKGVLEECRKSKLIGW